MPKLLSYGAYIPRTRLARRAIIEANKWFAGKMGALAKGERAIANWDEDTVTMAVAAGRKALRNGPAPSSIWLASTTAPFADRQNAAIVSGALGCADETATLDLAGSMRAASSALLTAFQAANETNTILLTTAEHRMSKAASRDELINGDAGAALLIGEGEGIAELISAKQISVDFVDHYRAAQKDFDYSWEERWLRDEGFAKLIPSLAQQALEEAHLAPSDIDHFILPAPMPALPRLVARKIGISEQAIADGLFETTGISGCAHGCLMLAALLDKAKAGETIMMIGFGQGVDVILLKTLTQIENFTPVDPVSTQLERGIHSENYMRYLSINNRVQQEHGLRAELDLQTAPTIMYRNRKMLLGFIGGACEKCGAVQFPRRAFCVNPNCGAQDSQLDYRFADTPATIQSYTSDNLTYTPDPPARYGMIRFKPGGALMMDITDATADEVDAGLDVDMVFRIKSEDRERGIKRYFWKATPHF